MSRNEIIADIIIFILFLPIFYLLIDGKGFTQPDKEICTTKIDCINPVNEIYPWNAWMKPATCRTTKICKEEK